MGNRTVGIKMAMLLAVSLVATTSGCSLLFVNGPPPEGISAARGCTTSNVAPVLDMGAAALWGIATVAGEVVDGDETATRATAGVITAIYGTSGIVGFGKTSRCREAIRELASERAIRDHLRNLAERDN